MNTLMTFITNLVIAFQLKIGAFLKKENGEVNIVAIIVLIGIAILLALVFKDRITSLINGLFDTIDTNAQNAVN